MDIDKYNGRTMINFIMVGDKQFNVTDFTAVAPEYQLIRSMTAVKPDMKWHWVDLNRHEHKWSSEKGDRIQTVVPLGDGHYQHIFAVKRRVRSAEYCYCHDCLDVENPGWTDVAWNCRLCGALIEPGYVPDWEAREGKYIKIQEGYLSLTLEVEGRLREEELPPGIDAKFYMTKQGANTVIPGRLYPSWGSGIILFRSLDHGPPVTLLAASFIY